MKFKMFLFVLIIAVVFISISSVAGEDSAIGENYTLDDSSNTQSDVSQRTFTATGKTIGYMVEGPHPLKYTKKAKKQLKKIKKTNKKNPTKYSITISKSQYDKLLNAKKEGKIKEIQIKTDKYVTIKTPVFKTVKKKIFAKKYYKQTKFDKALKKFKNKYYLDDNYKIKVKTKWKKSKDTSLGIVHIIKYKKITIIKKYSKLKYFKNKKDRITASICVNDRQYDKYGRQRDVVEFFAPKLGVYGTMAIKGVNVD